MNTRSDCFDTLQCKDHACCFFNPLQTKYIMSFVSRDRINQNSNHAFQRLKNAVKETIVYVFACLFSWYFCFAACVKG